MVDIPVSAKVECTDSKKACGESLAVIVNPITREVTYLVVEDRTFPRGVQRLVPMDLVQETSSDLVRLSCTEAELGEMGSFTETHYVKSENPEYYDYYMYSDEYYLPYAVPMTAVDVPIDVERVPEGELAVHRGDQVEATDGYVGTVDELLVDPDGRHVTHLVMREGHLWGKRQIALPLSAVDRVSDYTVYLKLDKHAIGQLPHIPATRKYKGATLVGRVFDTPDGASEALEFVRGLQRQKELKIRTSAVLVKDADGEVSLKETGDLTGGQGAAVGAVAGGIIGLLGGPLGAALGAAVGAGIGGLIAGRVDLGLSKEFLTQFEEGLKPGGSALIMVVDAPWVRKTIEETSDLEGVVLQETLTDEMVEQFLEAEQKKE